MDIKALAEKYEPYIVERRRYYHSCPELSNEEKETSAQIRRDLEAMGIAVREVPGCYGLVADIRGGSQGATVALRADMDALPIQEDTGLPFASKNEGRMHACGHDSHIAMLLGAAQILNEVKAELHGTVRLLVQPAEEVATGALDMLKGGALDGVSAIYGAHVWGNFDAPLIDMTPGSRMACCDKFTIEVEGVAAHASAPHLGVDAITVSAAIINNLQQCVSRMNDPLNPLVLTIGFIEGGPRWNVISNRVRMEGTVRTFDEDLSKSEIMRRIIEDTAAAFGAKGTLEYKRLTPPLINGSDKLNAIAREAVVKLYGKQAVGHMPTMMGSEDFPWLSDGGRIPYLFAFIGSRNQEKGITYTNHHEKYTVDEGILKRGAAVMAQFAADFLASA